MINHASETSAVAPAQPATSVSASTVAPPAPTALQEAIAPSTLAPAGQATTPSVASVAPAQQVQQPPRQKQQARQPQQRQQQPVVLPSDVTTVIHSRVFLFPESFGSLISFSYPAISPGVEESPDGSSAGQDNAVEMSEADDKRPRIGASINQAAFESAFRAVAVKFSTLDGKAQKHPLTKSISSALDTMRFDEASVNKWFKVGKLCYDLFGYDGVTNKVPVETKQERKERLQAITKKHAGAINAPSIHKKTISFLTLPEPLQEALQYARTFIAMSIANYGTREFSPKQAAELFSQPDLPTLFDYTCVDLAAVSIASKARSAAVVNGDAQEASASPSKPQNTSTPQSKLTAKASTSSLVVKAMIKAVSKSGTGKNPFVNTITIPSAVDFPLKEKQMSSSSLQTSPRINGLVS